MKHFSLASFSAERRFAAVAVFQGVKLEDAQLRHLPVDPSKALGSVRELLGRTLEDYKPALLAISQPSKKGGQWVRAFCDVAKEVAKDQDIPTVEVDDVTLRHAYGHPALTRKEHVRHIGRRIWPALSDAKSGHAAVDAATTGLYVQTERLFSLHEVTS